ncbi:MAG TPA: glycosyltransferase family 4 protein [Baekduia sp.]|nr:glycosyltransferase family 4 protein [Baekduia sp.]
MSRVLVVSPWGWVWALEGGGGNPVLRNLYASLVDAGYEVDVVAPGPGRHKDFAEFGPALRVHITKACRFSSSDHGNPAAVLGSRVATYLELNARLRTVGRRVSRVSPPDLVVALSTNTVPAASLIASAVGAPLVAQSFGTVFYEYLGSRIGRIGMFQDVLAFRFPVDHWLIHNDGTRGDRAAAILGVSPERLSFWTHGIDREACLQAAALRTARATLGLQAETPLIVSACRLVPVKRVDRVIAAFRRVLETVPEAVLAISGEGPAEGDLRRQVREAGVEASVRFTGALAREDNLNLMASASVFCAFGDQSNIGFTLAEALTCGVAVVATDVGGTSEFVTDGVNGLLVPPDDVTASAEAIVRILKDPDLRKRLAAAAGERAEHDFPSEDERVSREIQLYERMIREAGSRH